MDTRTAHVRRANWTRHYRETGTLYQAEDCAVPEVETVAIRSLEVDADWPYSVEAA